MSSPMGRGIESNVGRHTTRISKTSQLLNGRSTVDVYKQRKALLLARKSIDKKKRTRRN